MAIINEKFAYGSNPMSSSPPPSSPVASEKDLFTPLSSPPKALHSTPLDSRPSNARLFSGINESSNPANPTSAFYEHPTTRWSLQQAHPPQALNLDLESGLAPLPTKQAEHHLSSYSSRTQLTASSPNESTTELDLSHNATTSDSAVWPSRQELEEKALVAKRQECRRKWNFIGALDKRQKLYAQLLIGLVVVAAAVGLGVGISRAVGGGVYAKNGQTTQISQR